MCVSECVYETETRHRQRQGENEREGNISSWQLFFINPLHARSIFLISNDSQLSSGFLTHLRVWKKTVSPVYCMYATHLFISHLLAVIIIAFEPADMIQSLRVELRQIKYWK